MGKFLPFSDVKTVVDNIVMSKHDPLGKPVVPEVYCIFTTSWGSTEALIS